MKVALTLRLSYLKIEISLPPTNEQPDDYSYKDLFDEDLSLTQAQTHYVDELVVIGLTGEPWVPKCLKGNRIKDPTKTHEARRQIEKWPLAFSWSKENLKNLVSLHSFCKQNRELYENA